MDSKRLLLITGIPGTGKTTIGDHLRDAHGFKHFDIEYYLTNQMAERLCRELDAALRSGSDIVVTWGFLPVHDVPNIESLRAAGFRLIWFDGNRAAALREFNRRGTVKEEMYHLQIRNIEEAGVVDKLKPALINPFDEEGEFKSKPEIAAEVLRLA